MVKEIVYISSICWNYSWHRQQEMMQYFADNNTRVLFVEPSNHNPNIKKPFEIEKISSNIYILRFRALPFERCTFTCNYINSKLSRAAINKAVRQLGFIKPIIWMDRVHGFDIKYFMNKYKSVYDLIDEITAFGRWKNVRMLKRLEKTVFINSDIVLSSSQTLMKRKSSDYKDRKVYFIPNGIDYDRFADDNKGQAEYFKNDKPVIGFVGFISKRRINVDLINEIAAVRNDCNFVFVGPGAEKMKQSFKSSNIFCIDKVQNNELPGLIYRFDIGIIPYNLDEIYMDYVFPRKFFEYLACGKPVISTSLKELQLLKIDQQALRFADNVDELNESITVLLNQGFEKTNDLKLIAKQYDNKKLFRKIKDIINIQLDAESSASS